MINIDYRFREIANYIDKAQSTTSSHLRGLEHAGIISALRVNRKNQFYRLKNKSMNTLHDYLFIISLMVVV
jgi:DNA-binding transcriptional ArsR family regulator